MSSVPKRIKQQAMARDLVISVRIGRNGLTDALLLEMQDQLSKRSLVKVKANRGVVEGSDERLGLFGTIAESTGSEIVFQRGNVAVFWLGE